MLIKVSGAAVQGIDAYIVTIEASTSRGIRFFLVGLPDSAVKESHERIISAFQINGYKFPSSQIIINMAPADIRKEGAAYDLPLAIVIMASGGELDTTTLDDYVIMGEMSLDGSLQPVKGALSMAIKARAEGFKGIILPAQNASKRASSRISPLRFMIPHFPPILNPALPLWNAVTSSYAKGISRLPFMSRNPHCPSLHAATSPSLAGIMRS